MSLQKEQIGDWFQTLQDSICKTLETADGQVFQEDIWQREGGGGGKTRILFGNHIEKGGVNFSAVWGALPKTLSLGMNLAPESSFFATGVSSVLHPLNPHVPIIHMNVRYFELDGEKWWFGGGIDLTPHYVIHQDAQFFHQQLREVCDRHDVAFYPKFKDWADEYFYIKHRKETRGIGGIFFDHLNSDNYTHTKEKLFDFIKDIGNCYANVYVYFLNKYKNNIYTNEQKKWQYLRRGRYVEFNLVWDRGTKFGLDTDGRTESILMSLPPQANWLYDHQPDPDSPEAQTLAYLKKGIDWL